MSKRARLFIVLLVLVICGVFMYPTIHWYFIVPESDKELAAGSREQIRAYARGIASKGVNELKALAQKSPEASVPDAYAFLIDYAKENYKLIKKPLPSKWTVTEVLRSFKDENELFSKIEGYHRDRILELKDSSKGIMQLGLDLSGGLSILLQADMDSLAKRLGHPASEAEREQAMNRAVEILNSRIDKFGVTEPTIRRQGTDSIAIEVPGAADPERINSFLMGKGSLTFHIVNDELTKQVNDFVRANPGQAYDEKGMLKPLDFIAPEYEVVGFYQKDKYGIDQLVRYLVIYREVGLDGSYIQDATVGTHPVTGQPVINFDLGREGGEIFFKLTSEHQNETLAIVLDNKAKAGARISEPIRDRVQMTGFDRKEANDLAIVLRTASMPVDLKVVSQQAIGAALGEDAIQSGLKAATVGFLLVVIFMILYYLGAGINADIALILNGVIMVAVLSAFNLTVTLTSIAGFVLTLGMAVDANVIIFERMKEERRLGKTPDAIVKAGFHKAFWSIADSNITTFIAALLLSQFGSGPIKGFANTLAIGVVSSMFTALFVSRLIFDFNVEVLKVKKLSLGWRNK
ncbi:MAG TPA: protein translocase subunit SecD [Spirochaetia bacterium]|nr:protein translocase subunit SecD [Spirochaetia bacterium]